MREIVVRDYGYRTYSNSKKVRVSSEEINAETFAWLRNIGANGGTVSPKSVWANDLLIRDLKSYSLRSSIQYLLTYSGNQLAAGLCPIIYDIGTSAATNTNFIAGDFTEAGGLGSNPNTTKYLSLGFTDSQIGSQDSYSITNVLSAQITDPTPTSMRLLGTLAAGLSQNWTFLHSNGSGNGIIAATAGGSTIVAISGQTAKSVVTASRTSTTNLRAYVNGVGGTAVTTSTTSTPGDLAMVLFGRNTGSIVASDVYFHFVDCFGYGLNAAQAANLATCLNNFTTRIGR
jgi:hypothetical protein